VVGPLQALALVPAAPLASRSQLIAEGKMQPQHSGTACTCWRYATKSWSSSWWSACRLLTSAAAAAAAVALVSSMQPWHGPNPRRTVTQLAGRHGHMQSWRQQRGLLQWRLSPLAAVQLHCPLNSPAHPWAQARLQSNTRSKHHWGLICSSCSSSQATACNKARSCSSGGSSSRDSRCRRLTAGHLSCWSAACAARCKTCNESCSGRNS